MKKSMIALTVCALCLGSVALSFADHHQTAETDAGAAPAEMPPMGPPPEMEQVAGMNGEYDIKFYFKMSPMSPEWTETDATAEISMVAGGGAQQLLFEGNMMGMPFSGLGLTSYDRETEQWQMSWVDSMGARISTYTGGFEDGAMVVTGQDMAQGMPYESRLTTYNITDKGFDWKYEMSMDGGATYIEGAKATYTRK